jgi:predicted AlkP superfamily phosphohydrolase/phosphomutase
MPDDTSPRRVFLYGIDAATFTILMPWVEEGHLPHLAGLIREGTSGPLISTIPASTPLAWSSMVTGVWPGKHGIFGFVKTKPHSYELHIPTSRDRRRPAIWNLLSDAGLPSIVVDVPFTYPPEPVHGVMVSGMGTPDVTRPFVHPAHLRDVILRECGVYPLDVFYRGNVGEFLADARHLIDHRLRLMRFLHREFPWRFFMLVTTVADRMQHVLWKYLDPRHPRHEPAEARRWLPGIRDVYRRLDEAIGEIQSLLDGRTTLLLASDHGFGPLERNISLLHWLKVQGLAALGEEIWRFAPPAAAPRFRTRGPGRVTRRRDGRFTVEVTRPDQFGGAVFRLNGLDPRRRYELRAILSDATPHVQVEFDDLGRREAPIIGGGTVYRTTGRLTAMFQPRGPRMDLFVGMTTYHGNPVGRVTVDSLTLASREDWTGTAAFVLDRGDASVGRRIRLNVRGREPNGIIEPGEQYERVRQRIIDGLRDHRDRQGRPLVRRVYRREELYPGPHFEEAPDLLVLFEEGVGGVDHVTSPAGTPEAGTFDVATERDLTGTHRPEGIIVARGHGIRRGARVAANIVDVCPTVLDILGVPVPGDTDGRVLIEMLAEESPGGGQRGPMPVPVAGTGGRLDTVGPLRPDNHVDAYTDDDRAAVEERLRKLGYLD